MIMIHNGGTRSGDKIREEDRDTIQVQERTELAASACAPAGHMQHVKMASSVLVQARGTYNLCLWKALKKIIDRSNDFNSRLKL
jgi:hypothetical protein